MAEPTPIQFSVLNLQLTLRRYPLVPKDQHRAWDAADELAGWFLLGHVATEATKVVQADETADRPEAADSPEAVEAAEAVSPATAPVPKPNHRWPADPDDPGSVGAMLHHVGTLNAPRCLVVNDTFGCLTLTLAACGIQPWVLNDSWCAMESLWQNAAANQIELDPSRFLTSQDALPDDIELVLLRACDRHDERVRIDQLLRPHLAPNARLLTAAMVKANLHSELGSTTHSSIWKKSCLHLTVPRSTETEITTETASARETEITAEPDRTAEPANSAEPATAAPVGTVEHDGHSFTILPGVFAGQVSDAGSTIDPGTQFLLANLPSAEALADLHETQHEGIDLIDLGCGAGLLGIAMALELKKRGQPPGSVQFFDDSARAIECTQLNAAALLDDLPDQSMAFHWLDCLSDVPQGSADLVLCNPPFHVGNVRTDTVAWRMFTHTFRVLRPGGRFRLVGNRHLQYHAKLSKIFGNHQVVASDSRYVILDAVKQAKSAN